MEKFVTFSEKRKYFKCNDNDDKQSVSTKHAKYHKMKRIQRYLKSWEGTWSWLYYDNQTIYLNEWIE